MRATEVWQPAFLRRETNVNRTTCKVFPEPWWTSLDRMVCTVRTHQFCDDIFASNPKHAGLGRREGRPDPTGRGRRFVIRWFSEPFTSRYAAGERLRQFGGKPGAYRAALAPHQGAGHSERPHVS